MPMNWDHAASPRMQKPDYNSLRDRRTDVTRKVLDGIAIALTTGIGRGEAMFLLVLVHPTRSLIRRTIDSEAKLIVEVGWLPCPRSPRPCRFGNSADRPNENLQPRPLISCPCLGSELSPLNPRLDSSLCETAQVRFLTIIII
jgi:hypothetical protein